MNVGYYFYIFWLTCTVCFDSDTFMLEDMYWNYTEQEENFVESKIICNLEEEKIRGLCKYVLDNFESIDTEVYFSYTAFFYLKPKCQPKKIWSHSRQIVMKAEQYMMPCYGHAKPIRTNWMVDDYLDIIWIADGPEKDTIIVFKCRYLLSGSICVIHELITEKSIESIKKFELNSDDVLNETELLEYMSINKHPFEINMTYVFEFIFASDLCELSDDSKLKICKTILKRKYKPWYSFGINHNELKCTEQSVTLNSEMSVKRMMYLCGENKNNRNSLSEQFYLSSGSWYNSVIVYQGINEVISLYEFFEYINIDSILTDDDSTIIIADIFSIRDKKKITDIFIKEVIHDPVCDISAADKYNLCTSLSEREEFNYFHWIVDEKKFISHDVPCEKLSFQLREVPDEFEFDSRDMFPCYGKSSVRQDTAMEEFYAGTFYLSRGPRKNSVYMYKKVGDQRYIYEFLENFFE